MSNLTANLSNCTSQLSILSLCLDEATDILSDSVIPGICIFGILFNTFGITILSSHTLTNKFYDFLWCRCFYNLVICIFGVFFTNLKTPNKYMTLILEWHCLVLPSRILFFTSTITDVLLILNRLCYIANKTENLLMKLPKAVRSFLSYKI